MKLDDLLSPAQRAVARELRDRDRAEREAGIRTDASLKAVAPEVAELLFVLATRQGARRLVELGTSHGYSTLYLAAAAARTGGHLHSLDVLPDKTAIARGNLERAGLLGRVSLVTGAAPSFVGALPEDVDFVLVDVPLQGFVEVFEALRPKLAAGCLVFVDGGPAGYWDEGAGRPLCEHLERDPEFALVRLPLRKEQLLALRVARSADGPGRDHAPDSVRGR